ncbi:MAG: hypothetical protein WDN01_02830 [Rhizomicrobium sp.]
MRFVRFMDSREFLRELEPLRAFPHDYVGDGLLETLEHTGLLRPRLRIRFPDDVGRRYWLETHDRPRTLVLPVEPDGPRWDAAVALRNALWRWSAFTAYGLTVHPLDDPEPRFVSFLQDPATTDFVAWRDMRIDVSNEAETGLYDPNNVLVFYTTWQLLLAAEVADAGVRYRINLADQAVSDAAYAAVDNGRGPGPVASFNLVTISVVREYDEHVKAMDAMVWFGQECERALLDIVKDRGGGRFWLNAEQRARNHAAIEKAAVDAVRKHGVTSDDLVAMCQFLARRWSDWRRDGRPLIADAYREMIAETVRLTRYFGKLSYAAMRDRVGKTGGWFEPILDVIWPDWSKQEQDRVRWTLKGSLKDKGYQIGDDALDAFVTFLADKGQEAFFWRLSSFEKHVFSSEQFAREGMKSDLQGMALAVEHIAVALGGTKTQLYEKFKQLWRDADVLALLDRDDVSRLARQARLAEDWPALKAKIDALRTQPGGREVADLVMAHRVRGGVHTILPEDDVQALEDLFMTLMRAALLTFAEMRCPTAAMTSQNNALVKA